MKSSLPQASRSDRLAASDPNLTPRAGSPIAHPLGLLLGAAFGLLTGAWLGASVGPASTVIGGVVGLMIGAVAGGLVGRNISESLRPPTDEPYWDAYWRQACAREPYCGKGRSYEDFALAYRLGFTARMNDGNRTWESIEPGLKSQWEHAEQRSRIGWAEASLAANAAWRRVGYQISEVKKDNGWSR